MNDLSERIAHAVSETAGRTVAPPFADVEHRARVARTRRAVTAATLAAVVLGGVAAAIPRLAEVGERPLPPVASEPTEPPARDACYVGPGGAVPLEPCRSTVVETADPSFDDPSERICPGRLEGGGGRALTGTYEGHEWVVQGYRIGEESCRKTTVDGRLVGSEVSNGPTVDGVWVSAGRIDLAGGTVATLLSGAMTDYVAEVACTVGGDTFRAATGTTWRAPRTVFYGVVIDADPSSLGDVTCVGYGYGGTELTRTTLPHSSRAPTAMSPTGPAATPPP